MKKEKTISERIKGSLWDCIYGGVLLGAAFGSATLVTIECVILKTQPLTTFMVLGIFVMVAFGIAFIISSVKRLNKTLKEIK